MEPPVSSNTARVQLAFRGTRPSPVTPITARRVVLVYRSTQHQPEQGMETMWQQTVRMTIAGVMVWTVSVLAFAVAG